MTIPMPRTYGVGGAEGEKTTVRSISRSSSLCGCCSACHMDRFVSVLQPYATLCRPSSLDSCARMPHTAFIGAVMNFSKGFQFIDLHCTTYHTSADKAELMILEASYTLLQQHLLHE